MQQEGMGRSPALSDAVARAADEARRLGHRRVGSEHLLLGVLAEPAGAGKAVLEALRLEWAAVRTEIQELMPGSGRPIEGDLPLTDSAAGALRQAESAARRFGASIVDTDHLLLGIARQHEGIGSRVLTDFGATAEKIRLLVERQAAERRANACSQCGATLEAAWRYCPYCGTARVSA
jgi:ATP-dependent Clp protease ATP-binding subunit ClpC